MRYTRLGPATLGIVACLGATAAVAAIWSGFLWSLQPPSQTLASPGNAPQLMWFDIRAHCDRDCTVHQRYVMLSTSAGPKRFEGLLTDPMVTVRQNNLKSVTVAAKPAPAAAVDRLREQYGGNLVARTFGREGLHQVSFTADLIGGPNQFEIGYRQLLAVRGQGTENAALGFIFDASTLPAWQRSDTFKSTVKITFGPAMLAVLQNLGMKADQVAVRCSVAGGKAIPPESMQRQPASKDEVWMEFAGEAPTSLWCNFADPKRTN